MKINSVPYSPSTIDKHPKEKEEEEEEQPKEEHEQEEEEFKFNCSKRYQSGSAP
jgi:hypothetical protein